MVTNIKCRHKILYGRRRLGFCAGQLLRRGHICSYQIKVNPKRKPREMDSGQKGERSGRLKSSKFQHYQCKAVEWKEKILAMIQRFCCEGRNCKRLWWGCMMLAFHTRNFCFAELRNHVSWNSISPCSNQLLSISKNFRRQFYNLVFLNFIRATLLRFVRAKFLAHCTSNKFLRMWLCTAILHHSERCLPLQCSQTGDSSFLPFV